MGAGDGLAILTPAGADSPTRLLTIPFTLPDELVAVHVHRHEPDFFMSHGDLLRIIEPSPQRKLREGEVVQDVKVVSDELKATREKFGDRVQCKYFGCVPVVLLSKAIADTIPRQRLLWLPGPLSRTAPSSLLLTSPQSLHAVPTHLLRRPTHSEAIRRPQSFCQFLDSRPVPHPLHRLNSPLPAPVRLPHEAHAAFPGAACEWEEWRTEGAVEGEGEGEGPGGRGGGEGVGDQHRFRNEGKEADCRY